jgi:hypothetical protein
MHADHCCGHCATLTLLGPLKETAGKGTMNELNFTLMLFRHRKLADDHVGAGILKICHCNDFQRREFPTLIRSETW